MFQRRIAKFGTLLVIRVIPTVHMRWDIVRKIG
jgi:hypothetical protein